MASLNGLTGLLRWRLWRVTSRLSGAVLVLYSFVVLLLGHGEDVGGAANLITLAMTTLAMGSWSLILPGVVEWPRRGEGREAD